MHPPRKHVLLLQFLNPSHLQHIAFLFSVEKKKEAEKTKSQRAAPTAQDKNMRQ